MVNLVKKYTNSEAKNNKKKKSQMSYFKVSHKVFKRCALCRIEV